MFTLENLKRRFAWENMGLSSLLGYYRYISLLITSALYIVGPPPSLMYLKAILALCLFLEAFVFMRLFNMERQADQVKKLLITIETLGLAAILILTGGLDSPFLWYAINPILLAATLLPPYFCWVMMTLFLTSASFLQRFEIYGLRTTFNLWPDRYSFILIFVLITLSAQLFNHFIRRVSHQSEIMEEQLQHIKTLYEAVGIFCLRTDPQEVVSLFASYSKTMTGADKVFLWVETEALFPDTDTGSMKKSYYAVRGPRSILGDESWYPYVKEGFASNMDGQDFLIQKISSPTPEEKGIMLTVKIKSRTRVYGLLSAFFLEPPPEMTFVQQTINFLADLCAVALEKHSLESVTDEIMIMEEKDRIAREIHDNVTQNIFGLIYGIDLLMKKTTLPQEANEKLQLMQKTAQRSLKDLRTAIYRMSSLKKQQEPFKEDLGKYLHDLGQLNNVNVDFAPQGQLQHLPAQVQRSLYRIIREATGNSIRHGQCSNIKVLLDVEEGKVTLDITDDGQGFAPDNRADKGVRQGLGLLNMRELARNMGSELRLDTAPGLGTRIYCKINLSQEIIQTPGKEEQTIESYHRR